MRSAFGLIVFSDLRWWHFIHGRLITDQTLMILLLLVWVLFRWMFVLLICKRTCLILPVYLQSLLSRHVAIVTKEPTVRAQGDRCSCWRLVYSDCISFQIFSEAELLNYPRPSKLTNVFFSRKMPCDTQPMTLGEQKSQSNIKWLAYKRVLWVG